MKQDTLIVTAGRDPEANHGAVNPPVYHVSTILFPSVAALEAAQSDRTDNDSTYYGRFGTPTTFAFQNAVAEIDGGHRTIAVASGKCAILVALTAFLKSGDHLLMVDTAYGPTRALCDGFFTKFGVTTTYYDPLIGPRISNLIRPETRVIFTESPGSQTFEIQDIDAIAEAAHSRGCIVLLDNTWATPLFFRPFDHGVDVAIQAATKYIVGHSDVMMGMITTKNEYWQRIHDAMIGVTEEVGGSARTAMSGTAYRVAGKTGTAQVFSLAQDEEYDAETIAEDLRDHGLFIAFAPVEAPGIAVAVVVENRGGGSPTASSVARRILDTYFQDTEYVDR